MAITQQLARLTAAHSLRCRTSVSALKEVCSFTALTPSDYLDLDWAPGVSQQLARACEFEPALMSALMRATDGDHEVNPAYREHPDTIFDHPASALKATGVTEVHTALRTLDARGFPSPTSISAHQAEIRQIKELDEPHRYLRSHWSALVGFYASASHRNLSVIMWWD